LRGKRRRRGGSGGRRSLYLLVGGLFVLGSLLVSGVLIAYNELRGRGLAGRCDLPVLEGFGGVRAYFDTGSSLLPNLSLVALGPERARYEVYVFYDLYCPYCAWEFYESLHLLLGYAVSGKVKLYMVDTILHREAVRSHGILRASVGHGDAYLKALYLASCRLHLDGRDPDAVYMEGVMRELNVALAGDRVSAEEAKAVQVTRAAVDLLARLRGGLERVGTPTIVVYDSEPGEVKEVVFGRVPPETLDSTLRSLP